MGKDKSSSSKHGSSKHKSSKHDSSKQTSIIKYDQYGEYIELQGEKWYKNDEYGLWGCRHEDPQGSLYQLWSPEPWKKNPEISSQVIERNVPRGSEHDPVGNITEAVDSMGLSESPVDTPHYELASDNEGKGKGIAPASQDYDVYVQGQGDPSYSQGGYAAGTGYDDHDQNDYYGDEPVPSAGADPRYAQGSNYLSPSATPTPHNPYPMGAGGSYAIGDPSSLDTSTILSSAAMSPSAHLAAATGSQGLEPGTVRVTVTDPNGSYDCNVTQPSSSQGAYGNVGEENSDMQAHISGGYASPQNPVLGDFQTYHSMYFQPGMILMMPWCEPRGGPKNDLISEEGQSTITFGDLVYQGIRRFLIIASDQGHSHCLAISTYDGRACAKRGIKAHTHGIIYDRRKKPQLVKDEGKLGFDDVSANMEEGQTLVKTSRVNYAKSYTIEHNTRVTFVGNVPAQDFQIVQKAHNKCWERMNREHGGSSSHHHHRRKKRS